VPFQRPTFKLGRSHIEKAFNHILIPTPFVLVSGLLAVWHALTYIWDRGPWLCSYLPLPCKIFRPFFLGLFFYPIFIILALSTLDEVLTLSPIFQRPEAYATSPSVVHPSQERSANTGDSQPSASSDLPVILEEDGKQRVRTVFLILVIAASTFAALWGLACFSAIAEALFIALKDHPFADGSVDKYMERFLLNCSEAASDGLLARFMVKAANMCLYARYTLGADDQEGTEPPREVPSEARISRILQTLSPPRLKLYWHRLEQAVRALSFTQLRDGWCWLSNRIRELSTLIGEVDWRSRRDIIWDAWKAFAIANWKAYWHRYRRTALERCLGYLLFLFGLAIVSLKVFLLRSWLVSNIYVYPDLNYCLLALLTLAFAYTFLLRYHSYRSAGV
jgi:hypothetical protein